MNISEPVHPDLSQTGRHSQAIHRSANSRKEPVGKSLRVELTGGLEPETPTKPSDVFRAARLLRGGLRGGRHPGSGFLPKGFEFKVRSGFGFAASDIPCIGCLPGCGESEIGL